MFTLLTLPLVTLATYALASPYHSVERSVTSNHGTIHSPLTGSVIQTDTDFAFQYANGDWCEDGYSPVTIWLTGYAPTTANLNATGMFDDGDYTLFYGSYTQPNFGLPVMSNNVPSSLTLPDSFPAGETAYLVVVEGANNCPPRNIPTQYGLTNVVLISA